MFLYEYMVFSQFRLHFHNRTNPLFSDLAISCAAVHGEKHAVRCRLQCHVVLSADDSIHFCSFLFVTGPRVYALCKILSHFYAHGMQNSGQYHFRGMADLPFFSLSLYISTPYLLPSQFPLSSHNGECSRASRRASSMLIIMRLESYYSRRMYLCALLDQVFTSLQRRESSLHMMIILNSEPQVVASVRFDGKFIVPVHLFLALLNYILAQVVLAICAFGLLQSYPSTSY